MDSQSTSSSAQDQERELANFERKLVILGTDVGSIPCFRNTFLYGICSGFGAGIAHFAFFSKVTNATRCGVWSFAGVSLSYWIFCRYTYSVTRFKYKQLKYALKSKLEVTGTSKDFDSSLDIETKKS